jgi:hypothetical protein
VNSRLLTCVALAAATAVAVAPAHAAPKKKAITKTYKVTLPPDPTGNVGTDGCAGLLPISQDQHPFTVPAKGALKVHLSSEDPTGAGNGLDWDLALLDADGETLNTSTAEGAEEETYDKFKKKTRVLIQACNLTGLPDATVTFTFTYA